MDDIGLSNMRAPNKNQAVFFSRMMLWKTKPLEGCRGWPLKEVHVTTKHRLSLKGMFHPHPSAAQIIKAQPKFWKRILDVGILWYFIEGSFIPSEFWASKVSGFLHGDLEGECENLLEKDGYFPWFWGVWAYFRGEMAVSFREKLGTFAPQLVGLGGKPPTVSPEGRWVSGRACRARFKPEFGEGFGGGFAKIEGLNIWQKPTPEKIRIFFSLSHGKPGIFQAWPFLVSQQIGSFEVFENNYFLEPRPKALLVLGSFVGNKFLLAQKPMVFHGSLGSLAKSCCLRWWFQNISYFDPRRWSNTHRII